MAVKSAALNGGEIGGPGGGELEPSRPWWGAQWAGLSLAAPSGPSGPKPSGAPWRGTGAELGQCPGWTLTMLRHLLDSPVEVPHHLLHRVEVAQVTVRDAESKPSLARREHLPRRKCE